MLSKQRVGMRFIAINLFMVGLLMMGFVSGMEDTQEKDARPAVEKKIVFNFQYIQPAPKLAGGE
jgi:hypothetical protein